MGQWMRQPIHLSVPPALSVPATLDKLDSAGNFADVQRSNAGSKASRSRQEEGRM